MSCPCCGKPVPRRAKYCGWDCSVKGRTMIDIDSVLAMRDRGLSADHMEASIPATAGAIRKHLSRRGISLRKCA